MVTVAQISRAASDYYRIPQHVLFSPRRERPIVRPRQVVMYLAREMTQHSFPEIGRYLGQDGRVYDHTTVLYAWRRVNQLCADDDGTRNAVAAIRKRAERTA